MVKEDNAAESLVEQILDDLLSRLEKQEEFDAETLKRIKVLAESRGLTSTKHIEAAIKGSPREKP